MEETRVCIKCSKEKPLDKFPFKDKAKRWRKHTCKTCFGKKNTRIKAKNPEKLALRQRNNWLKRAYGIDNNEYERMYTAQEGKCKICENFHEKLLVDHCHETKLVRGLLCDACNKFIGHAKESSYNLYKAISYLKETNTDKCTRIYNFLN